MQVTYESVEQAAKQLTMREKAALAHTLLKDLDEVEDDDVEAIWAEEIERRAEAYKRGLITSSPTDEVVARVRARIGR